MNRDRVDHKSNENEMKSFKTAFLRLIQVNQVLIISVHNCGSIICITIEINNCTDEIFGFAFIQVNPNCLLILIYYCTTCSWISSTGFSKAHIYLVFNMKGLYFDRETLQSSQMSHENATALKD